MSRQALEIKERGILFSAEMVLALLDGRKTQTRRIIKPSKRDAEGICILDDRYPYNLYGENTTDHDGVEWPIVCPYARQPGDRMWVRETWRPVVDAEDPRIEYRCGGIFETEKVYGFYQHSDELERSHKAFDEGERFIPKWHSPIHMFRWASRITLEVTDVRVERVQDISEEDARAEGCEPKETRVVDLAALVYGGPTWVTAMSYKHGLQKLWDSINAKPGYSWESNPWVWVIQFKKI